MTATLPVVIIGFGMAAYGVARQFRKLDKTTPLTMVSGDCAEHRIGAGAAAGQPYEWISAADGERTFSRFIDEEGVMRGLGLSLHK